MPKPLPIATVTRIQEKLREGQSRSEVAAHYGVTRRCVDLIAQGKRHTIPGWRLRVADGDPTKPTVVEVTMPPDLPVVWQHHPDHDGVTIACDPDSLDALRHILAGVARQLQKRG